MLAGQTQSLAERVAARDWYHTIELAPGVVTPGYFDLRSLAGELLPSALAGARCLDVATFDGFWALEMAKRGASQVVATDILDARRWDWPAGADAEAIAVVGGRKGAGEGFEIVMDTLGMGIERHDLSVYDLDPDALGTFDFVYVGSLLLHLRDPVRAVERIRSVCTGGALFVDAVDPVLSRLHPWRAVASFDGVGRPWWWKPNVAGLTRLIESGGFAVDGKPRRVRMKPGAGYPATRVSAAVLRSHRLRADLINARLGDPHAAVMARPA